MDTKQGGKTAIVIGATGLVGLEVVNKLAVAKHIANVVSITRRPVEHASAKVQNKVVNFDNLANTSNLFAGHMLFSCLGTTLGQAGSIKAQRVVDLDYQYAAAKLAMEQGVKHYLLVSSSGANAKSLSPYMRMKGELEELIQRLPFDHISIFQPSLLLGERNEHRAGENFASLLLPTVCKLPGLGRYRPIKGSEVAEKMVAVSQQPTAAFERFTLDQVFP